MKKVLLSLFAFVLVMFAVTVKVSAKEFSEIVQDVMSPDGYTINADDEEITFNNEEWIGPNGRITINSGSVTLLLDNYGRINITINGEATINTGKQFIMQLEINSDNGTVTYPVTLTVTDTSTLNVLGNLAIPSGTQGVLVNAGTINVSGKLEIRANGKLESTGAINLNGNLVVYGDTTDSIGTSKINVLENGNVYSQVDLKDNLIIAAAEVEGFTWNVVDNTKEYTSFTEAVGTVTFAYGYKLLSEENQVTEPTEPTEDVENPSTLDNVQLFVGLGILSVVGLATTTVVLKKRHN